MLNAGVQNIKNITLDKAVERVKGKTTRIRTDPQEFLNAFKNFKKYMHEFNKQFSLDDTVEMEMEEFFTGASDDDEDGLTMGAPVPGVT